MAVFAAFWLGAAPAGAQPTFVSTYSFTAPNGTNPYAGLVQGNDGNFYGTAYQGGSSNDGTVFGLFGPPTTVGASKSTAENTPVSFTVAFDDPCGRGSQASPFPSPRRTAPSPSEPSSKRERREPSD